MNSHLAVFLDLQGTLGGNGLGNILDFEFFPQAIPAIELLNSSGLTAIAVTNQSQIGRGCDCCRPRPDMVLQAKKDFQLDLSTCYVVGDTGAWDMLLAKATGRHSVLVRTGLGESSLGEYRHTWADYEADFIAEDVVEAARWIVKGELDVSNPNPKDLKDL